MKNTKNFIKISGILGLAITAITSTAATAQSTNPLDSNWYIGGNIGQSEAEIDNKQITESLLGAGYDRVFIEEDGRDRGYKLFGGYQFNRYFALEGGYFDLGEFGFDATVFPTGTLEGNIKLKGVNLDAVGFLPFTEKFSAFGRVGVNYAEAKDSFRGTGSVNVLDPNPKEKGANVKVGAGLQYAFTEKVAMRLEAERYRVDDAVGNKGDVDLFSVGIVYRFGNKTAAPAPVYVAPAPTPAPAPAPTPPPAPKFEKYTLSATELFAFDSSAVNLPQRKLDEITEALKGEGAPKRIVITGYTDNLGSDAYNQKLSERRAVAVKDYMVAQGITADRLNAVGKGEADPVVVCNDKKLAALKECLKPNRRVEIDEIPFVREVEK